MYIAKVKLVLIFLGWLSFCVDILVSVESKIKPKKIMEHYILFVPCIFLSQIQKKITQTIVALFKGFSYSFKVNQTCIFEYFFVISWKCLVKNIRANFSKNINNLDAERFRGKRLLPSAQLWIGFQSSVSIF